MSADKKVIPFPNDDDGSALFNDVASMSDHEMQLTMGAITPPVLPLRWSHPVVQQFPPMPADQYAELREDIRRNGQRRAIGMYQGYVWDGRSRYNACVELGLVPKLWILRVRDPIIYLLERHPERYGAPRSPERTAALNALRQIETYEWIVEAKRRREEWMEHARSEFRKLYKVSRPCCVCGLGHHYSHAHHSLPLNIQYDIGVASPIQEYDWLCHLHHKHVHRLFAANFTPTRRNVDHPHALKYEIRDAAVLARLEAVFNRGLALFAAVGGIAERGNWNMVRP